MQTTVNFNVLDTICEVSAKIKDSQFQKDSIKDVKKEIDLLSEYFNLSNSEILLFVAIFTINYDSGETLTIRDIASFFDVTILNILQKHSEIKKLKEQKLIELEEDSISCYWNSNYINCDNKEIPLAREKFAINNYISLAIFQNSKITKRMNKNGISPKREKTSEEFVSKVSNIIDRIKTLNHSFRDMLEEILKLEQENRNIHLVKKTQSLIKNVEHRLLFYKICSELDDYKWKKDSVVFSDVLESLYNDKKKRYDVVKKCLEKKHPLCSKGLISLIEDRGSYSFSYNLHVQLEPLGWNFFYEEYKKVFYKERDNNSDKILNPENITTKDLFFSKKIENQLSFLSKTLENDNFLALQKRLEKQKLCTGVCVLFYGSPGTGKTESVLQIAKQTGRSVMQVDISEIHGMFLGESEKNIKEVFKNYYNACKNATRKPILLFNEADAIFSKRLSLNGGGGAQQAINAVQNIILEEMENLNGILIATTNLTENFDSAFERRFLFKIEFETPSLDAKEKIWQSKLNFLSQEESQQLAKMYDFSGGEIDNIARKCIMQDIISDKKTSLTEIENLCKEEKISKKNKAQKIGFSSY